MGLIRLIFLALIVTAGFWLWRQIKQLPSHKPQVREDTDAPLMVACAHCKVHLPESQAVRQHQQWFCSHEHAHAGTSGHDE